MQESTPAKGGLLKGFASRAVGLFVETEADQPAPSHLQPSKPHQSNPPLATTQTFVSAAPAINPEMLQRVRQVAYTRVSPFKTLIDTAERLRAIIPNDGQRLQAAFLSVNGDGQRSASSITESIKLHIQDVEGERGRFKQASDAQRKTNVDQVRANAKTKLQQAEAKVQQIAQLQQQIAQLNAESNELQASATALENEAVAADQQIGNVETQFNAAADAVVRELNQQFSDLSAVLIAK